MEEKDKIDKAIEQAIRKVGQERDANDIAALKRFMYEQELHKYKSCASYSMIREDDCGDKLKPRKKKTNRNSFIAIITSIAAIMAIVFSFNIYQDNRRMDKLFETYYTPLEYDSQLMARGDEIISPELTSAMEAYQNKDYATALQRFNAIPQVDENYLIYKAICLLETDKTKDAISLLEKLVDNGESTEYYQQACWYLALAYLCNHEDEKAIKIMQQNNINNSNIDYQELIDVLQ